MSPIADPREAFPLAPAGGRVPRSSEEPSDVSTRPWILRFAVLPDAQQAISRPAAVYDAGLQISLGVDTDQLPYLATHTPTVPDGSTASPPPLDEGPKD